MPRRQRSPTRHKSPRTAAAEPTSATTPRAPRDRRLLYGTVFITGAAIMVLELLGTRIIGPFYGSSLYVWSALITVTLIALALGYWSGGLIASAAPRVRISHVVALAGLLIAAVPLIAPPVLEATNSLGLRAGALTSSLILFLPPLTLLGMTGPLVIQQSTQRLAAVGLTSGTVYAISTVGSVLGTMLFGFYLLPTLGSRTTLLGCSGTLLLLAAVLEWLGRGSRPRAVAVTRTVGAGLLLLVVPVALGQGDVPSDGSLLFESESLYGRVRVVDDPESGVRWLLSDSSTISAAKIDTGLPVFPYLRLLEAVPDLRPGGQRALLVGLGGGFIPRLLEPRGIVTDCIEIDQAVVDAARAHFGFEPQGLMAVGDGRYEIRQLEGGYDFVFHDCFTGGSVPSHLLSLEVLQELAALMRPGGLLCLNYFGLTRGRHATAVAAIQRTIGEVFPHVEVLTAQPGSEYCDLVYMASDQPIDLSSVPPRGGLPEGWLDLFAHQIPESQGFVITDDYNPLDHLQVRKAEAYRDVLVERVGLDVLAK